MWIVDVPALSPAQCAITKRAVPCIDTGNDFDFDHTGRQYYSVGWIVDMYRLVQEKRPDLVPLDADAGELEELRARVAQLEADLAESERVIQAIDVMESKGFTQRKKTGRPPKKKAEEAVNG